MEEHGGYLMPEEFIKPYREHMLKLITAPTLHDAVKIAEERKGGSPTFGEVMDVFRKHYGVEKRKPLEIPKI